MYIVSDLKEEEEEEKSAYNQRKLTSTAVLTCALCYSFI